MIVPAKTVLRKKRIAVHVLGPNVTLEIGNYSLDLPYEVALRLSAWMRLAGKQAKRNSGDLSKSWMVSGALTDAREALRKEQTLTIR